MMASPKHLTASKHQTEPLLQAVTDSEMINGDQDRVSGLKTGG